MRDRNIGDSRGEIETGAEDQRRGEGDEAGLSIGGKEVRIYGSKHFPSLRCDDLPIELVRCIWRTSRDDRLPQSHFQVSLFYPITVFEILPTLVLR